MVTKRLLIFVLLMAGAAINADAQKTTGSDLLADSPLDIFIPNAFTPNGDGLNDSFKTVINGPELDLYEFAVLDRNGKEVFYTTNPDENWNGTIKGSNFSTGTSLFIYILKIKSVEDRSPMTLKGHIVLIR